jgi:hypothetical protein
LASNQRLSLIVYHFGRRAKSIKDEIASAEKDSIKELAKLIDSYVKNFKFRHIKFIHLEQLKVALENRYS